MIGHGVRGVSWALAAALLAATSGVSITIAQAQQQTAQRQFTFNIPAKPVPQAVNDIGRVTGLSVVFRENRAITANGNPVRGSLTAQQALSALLAGTGLTYRFSNATTVQIFDPAASAANGAAIASDGSLVLDTITVQGQAINNWDAPPVYPGGQVARGGQLGILGNVDVMNAPFSQTSYTEKYLKDQQATNLREALVADPSVRVDSSADGMTDSFNIRGFGALAAGSQERTINGVPGVGSSSYRIPVELYERVEVLKGPSAFLSGTTDKTTMGGTINVVTKRATSKPINSVTFGYMSNKNLGTHIDFGRRWGDNNEFGIRANGVFHDGEANRPSVDRRTGAGAIALDYRGERLRTSLDIIYQNSQVIGSGPLVFLDFEPGVPKPPKASRSYVPTNATDKANELTIISQSEFDLTPNWMLFSSVGYHSQNSRVAGVATGLVNNSGYAAYRPDATDVGYKQSDLSFQGGIRGQFNTGWFEHSVTAFGSTHSRDNGSIEYGSYPIGPLDIYNPDFTYARTFPKLRIPTTQERSFNSAGISDTISVLDGRAKLLLGLRYQSNSLKTFDETSGARKSGFDVTALTPMVGLVIKPIDDISIYGSYIEGLTPGFVVDDRNATNYGAVFSPVKTKQYEAGLKWDLGRVSTTLAMFQIEEPSVGADYSAYTYAVNGLKRVRGFEWSVFGELRHDIRILGGVTIMDGSLEKTPGGTNDGNVAPGVPRLQGNLGIEWDTPWIEGLTLTGRAVYTGSQYVNSDNTKKIPDWTRFDVGARYKAKINNYDVTFRAGIDNVFNKSYWESTYYGYMVGLSLPRTFRLSAQVQW